MGIVSNVSSRRSQSSDAMHFKRLRLISVSAVLFAACDSGASDQAARDDQSPQPAPARQASAQQATLPQTLCNLLPRADAEKIMGKGLTEQRNDDSACHYQDAVGTTGTGLMVDLNAFDVADQCRLTPRSEPLSGVGSEACIAVGQPAGLYTTLVFRGGGRTFVVTAPGQDKASELATAVARVILSKLGT
jgi:hypothetical protein